MSFIGPMCPLSPGIIRSRIHYPSDVDHIQLRLLGGKQYRLTGPAFLFVSASAEVQLDDRLLRTTVDTEVTLQITGPDVRDFALMVELPSPPDTNDQPDRQSDAKKIVPFEPVDGIPSLSELVRDATTVANEARNYRIYLEANQVVRVEDLSARDSLVLDWIDGNQLVFYSLSVAVMIPPKAGEYIFQVRSSEPVSYTLRVTAESLSHSGDSMATAPLVKTRSSPIPPGKKATGTAMVSLIHLT